MKDIVVPVAVGGCLICATCLMLRNHKKQLEATIREEYDRTRKTHDKLMTAVQNLHDEVQRCSSAIRSPGQNSSLTDSFIVGGTHSGTFSVDETSPYASLHHRTNNDSINSQSDVDNFILRDSVLQKCRQRALRQLPILRKCPQAVKEELVELLEITHFRAGEVICRQGDYGDCMYLVAMGSVVVKYNEHQFTRVVGQGGTFGEVSFAFGALRSATCTANTDVDIFILRREACSDIIAKHDEFREAVELEACKRWVEARYPPNERYDVRVQKEIHILAKDELRKFKASNSKLVKHWKAGKIIGQGAAGVVYEAIDLETGRHLAVKVMRSSDFTKADVVNLRNEGLRLAALDHPHIVRGYGVEVDEDAGEAYMIMELMPSGSLLQLVQEFGSMSEHVIREYTRQILRGLHYLHSNHILHRDIKPGNLLRSADGTIKLADFGLCRNDLLVSTQNIQGTPYYLSPEAISGKYSIGSDIWALGCTIVELYTGKPPWAYMQFESVTQLLYHVGMTKEPPKLPKGMSVEMEEVLEIMLSMDPVARKSADELLQLPWFSAVLDENSLEYQPESLSACYSFRPTTSGSSPSLSRQTTEASRATDVHTKVMMDGIPVVEENL